MVPAPASICAAELVRDEGSPGWACPLAATRRHRRNRAGLKLLGPARGFVTCRLAFPPSLGTARRQEPSQICVNVCAAQCGHRARRADKASIDVRLKTDAWSHSASQSPASRCPPSPPMPLRLGSAAEKPASAGSAPCSVPPGPATARCTLLHPRQLRIGESEFRKGHTKLCVSLFSYTGH